MVDMEISIGDYVVSGGELPAMIVIDAVLRLLPGAIDEASPVDESFSNGLLEYPQYTRPPSSAACARHAPFRHHGAVDEWRRQQSLERRLGQTGRICSGGTVMQFPTQTDATQTHERTRNLLLYSPTASPTPDDPPRATARLLQTRVSVQP